MRSHFRSVISLIMFLLLAFVLLMPAAGSAAGHSGTNCGCSTTETSETYSTTSTSDSSTSTTDSSTTESTSSTESTGSTTTETTTSETTTTVTRHITPPPTSTDAGSTTQGQSGGALVILGVLGLLGVIVFLLFSPQRTTSFHVDHLSFDDSPVEAGPQGPQMTSVGTSVDLGTDPES